MLREAGKWQSPCKNKVAGWYGALACTTFLFFVSLSSGTWNLVFVVLLKSPDVDAHVFRVAGPWLQEENWRFAIEKRWFHNWSLKKNIRFFVFQSRTPRLIFDDSSFDSFANPFHSWSSNGLHRRFEHGLHHSFGHVWNMYRSSPFGSTLNTGYITPLDMCEVRTKAVHSVALWTRVTSQLWTCVKYEQKQSIP